MKKFIYSLFVLACSVMAFSSCEDVPAPYNMPQEVIDDGESATPTGSGTADDPYNAVAANQLGASLEADALSQTVYVKGIVSRITEIETSQYGNAIFYISEDGTTNNEFYVFHCYSLGGEKFTSEDELKVGDEVIVCGQITNYYGNTVELASYGYIYSLNGTVVPKDDQSTAEPAGEGTLESPYNVAKALDLISSGANDPDAEVYIKGKVSAIQEISTGFGNATYSISDDGTTTTQLDVYRGYYLNGEDFTSEDQLKVGDEVVILGKLVKFYEKLQVGTGSSIVSINGQGGTVAGDGTEANPYLASQALELIKSGEIPSTEVYVKGIVSQVGSLNTKYNSLTYYISDDGTTTNHLQVYGGLYFGGEGFTSADQLQVGDEVVVRGNLAEYGGTAEVDKNNVLISLNGQTSATTGVAGEVAISGNSVTLTNPTATAGSETATLAATDVTGLNRQDVLTTLTLSDGSVITFDTGDGITPPAYYNTDLRIYANNTIHFSCKKPIAKIVFTCSGSDRVGNDTATFTVSGAEATYTNVFTGTSGGGTQLRITNIEVTYAK